MPCVSAKWFVEENIDIGLEALEAAIDTGKGFAALAPIQGLDTVFAVLSSIVESVQVRSAHRRSRFRLRNLHAANKRKCGRKKTTCQSIGGFVNRARAGLREGEGCCRSFTPRIPREVQG